MLEVELVAEVGRLLREDAVAEEPVDRRILPLEARARALRRIPRGLRDGTRCVTPGRRGSGAMVAAIQAARLPARAGAASRLGEARPSGRRASGSDVEQRLEREPALDEARVRDREVGLVDRARRPTAGRRGRACAAPSARCARGRGRARWPAAARSSSSGSSADLQQHRAR